MIYAARGMAIRNDTTQTDLSPDGNLETRLEAFRNRPGDRRLYAELSKELQNGEKPRQLAELEELQAQRESDPSRKAGHYFTAGKAHVALGAFKAAERNFRAATHVDAAHPAAIHLGDLLLRAQRYAEAADLLEAEVAALRERESRIPERKRGDFNTHRVARHRTLAELWYRQLGRIDRALEHWQRAWHLAPDDTTALESARAIYASLGDEAMVAELYQAELERLGDRGHHRRRAQIELALGRVMAKRGDRQGAINHLEAALKLDPAADGAREALARVYSDPAFSDRPDYGRRAAALLTELGERRLRQPRDPRSGNDGDKPAAPGTAQSTRTSALGNGQFDTSDDDATGIELLEQALTIDPTLSRAAKALEEALAAAERWDDLDLLFSRQYEYLKDGKNHRDQSPPAQAKRANEQADILHKRIRLYEEHLGNRSGLEESLVALVELTPPGSEPARKLRSHYRAEENWAALANLIENELPLWGNDRSRKAAEMLELATIVREHLGERERAAEILHQILREVAPGHPEALARYGEHFRERRDWRGLIGVLEFAVETARKSGAAVADIARQLEEIADIAEQRLGDVERAIHTWRRIKELEPRSNKPDESVRRLESRAKMWTSLVGVLEQEAQNAKSPNKRAEALRRIAQVYRERQVNPRRAIALYEEVIGIFPDDAGALKALAELYDREGDERGLAATLRRRLDLDMRQAANVAGTDGKGQPASVRDWPMAKRVERLTSLRRLASMYDNLGDLEGTIFACTGILEALAGDRDALDRLEKALEKAGDIEQLEKTLTYHISAASGPAERTKVLRRLARIALDRDDQEEAMQRWSEVLKSAPNDLEARDILADLYQRHQRYEEMARVLERGLIGPRPGIRVRADTQPSTKSPPRAATHSVRNVANTGRAATSVSVSRPGRAQTQADLGRGAAVASTTTAEIRIGTGLILKPKRRVADLKRYARVVDGQLEDTERATRAWQQLIELEPGNRKALTALARLHERSGRWRELAAVLAAQIPLVVADAASAFVRPTSEGHEIEAPLAESSDSGAVRARASQAETSTSHPHAPASQDGASAELSTGTARSASASAADLALKRSLILEERLGAPNEAIQALEELLDDLEPGHLEAHRRLRHLYELRGDFESAVRIAEREIYLTDSVDAKIARGLEIGRICNERLHAPYRALQAYDRVLNLDGDHIDALQAAAELYARVEDWRRHIALLERLIALAGTALEQRDLMSRIAQVQAERLRDPNGAFSWLRRAHEHLPGTDSMAELRRLAETYELWEPLAEVYEAERERLTGEDGQPVNARNYLAICRELAQVAERRLSAPVRAINVLLDAIMVRPRADELLAETERIATEHDQRPLWQLLLECLGAAIEPSPRSRRVSLHMRRARIYEAHLDDAEAAAEELLKAFAWSPNREDIRSALYELAERKGTWNDVIAVETALLERTGQTDGRLHILRRKAAIIEDKLDRPVRAFRIHLRSFLMRPEDGDTVAHLWRLGRLIGHPYRDSDKTPRSEPPAAYVHPPEPTRRPQMPYTQETPMPNAGGAQDRAAGADGRYSTGSATDGRGQKPRSGDEFDIDIDSELPAHDPTQELNLSDLRELMSADPSLDDEFSRASTDGDEPSVDPTMQLSIDELDFSEERGGSRKRRRRAETQTDPTIELRTEDLIVALREDTGRHKHPGQQQNSGQRSPKTSKKTGSKPPPPPQPPPFLPGVSSRKPPPPPQKKANAPKPPPRPQPAAAQAPMAPIPKMPVRGYNSPWEEFATAYDLLPASDPALKMRWLFRAAEVWETGAEDVSRAFNTLARALEIDVEATEPRARLQRLAAAHDAWDRLADLYEAAAEEARTGEAAAGLIMEVADIRARQQRPRETEAMYRRVLGMRPNDPVARERLESLYRSENRWVDLAASLEERTDHRLGGSAPEQERPTLLRELADIYRRRLNRPHDAIDALLRLRDIMPEEVSVLRELADLYSQVGRWSKVIEMLARLGEIAEGTPPARDALRRIAQIYRNELELPDRAIDAYSQLVSQWPDDTDAYAALDQLLEALGRWKDLADILRRRIGLTRAPEERAQLLRRRAAVLMDRLGAPEEAAAALRHARTIAAQSSDLEDELVRALIASGRAREAASVLEARIQSGVPARIPTADGSGEAPSGEGDLAALMIRLADLQAEKLADVQAAKITLQRALALVPDHPTALAALARMIESEQDPRAYADARLREAEALEDQDAKVEALMDAGLALRDRVGDIDGARQAFEAILHERPYHPDATWALAGLVEHGGDPDHAAQVLQARLQNESLDPSEAARILTQLAALARLAGVEAVAEQRLIEALRAAPSHLPAIIALADLFGEAERYQDLESFLRRVLPELEHPPAATLAELNRRLALACEHLGRDDEAYQILLDADKLHRGHLLVKLALGLNRFRAQRWREAALHLGSLAMHVDAAHYPAEVAEGLYYAAQAEIRSLRPEKARPLYERAIDLKPNYTPVLHALAELATEQGEHKRAAELLDQQANATEDPLERMRLFEALGDMAVETLRDDTRALGCYQAAVEAAAPLEAKHLPLLEKLLQRQELAGDHRGAARTAELMASFGTDLAARASRYTAAAENYLAVGEDERARQAASRAVEADPHDLTAVTVLSELLLKAKAYEEVTAVLGRALSRQESDDEFTAPRKSLLWNWLAQARKARGDLKGAITAWERAVAIAGNSDGAMSSRRELIEAWKNDADKRAKVLEYRRILAVDTLELNDVVTYARALCRAKHDDGGRAMLELAYVMGHELNHLDQSFLQRRPVHDFADDESYRGVLDPALRDEVILDRSESGAGGPYDDGDPYGEGNGGDDTMTQMLNIVWEAAALLWPDPDEALEQCGVAPAIRVAPPSELPAVNMFSRIAHALDAPASLLYTTPNPEAADVQVVCAATPIVVIGPRLLGLQGEAPDPIALRFLLGRAAELIRPANIIAAGLPETDFYYLLDSLMRQFGPPTLHDLFRSEFPDPEAMQAYDQALLEALPVKHREQLPALLRHATARDIDPERFFSALDRAADRAGMLVCGDIATAVANAGALDERGQRATRHLIMTALSTGYLAARDSLGVGVREQ